MRGYRQRRNGEGGNLPLRAPGSGRRDAYWKVEVGFTHGRRTQKKTRSFLNDRASRNNAGSDLLSHTVSHTVPSAVSGLTSVFGMGTGVTLIL